MRTRKALALPAAFPAPFRAALPAPLPAVLSAVRPAVLSACLSAALLVALAPAASADVGNGGGARPAPALPSRVQATCGDGKSTAFPIGARIRGGPAVYRTGGDAQSWYLDLTNTTGDRCTAIHPVIVFTDKARALRPADLRMEFEAPGGPHPVTLEHTDRDEIIAVFDGGDAFSGFSVGAGGSLTVKVQLAFAPDAPLGEVVADAALVQRKADDGDWVGEAGGYRFFVEGDEDSAEGGALAHTGPREWVYAVGSAVALATGGGLLLGARRLRARAAR
ncbi:hypothetical protein OHA84_14600 [Streptomyces sp. NBC_00513]|uniref:hypothetical protein n=1 Tax=unclassified Streptomyces TaxID=2593676 RepID=UPI002251849D|nr:hypothetical protein [Streptomyces sp. NBC_00424]MCX5075229.1 hypothetical protein [Streptomyces sp. NBC_00424]WUD41640.1 hypothetical protein OHA84_14600 [Streptomyces sp. NBC_00513]